jgi:Fe-S-cluster containining protein
MIDNKYDYTIDGKCPEGCNKCCSNILTVSQKEIARIKKYISQNNIEINNPNSIVSGYIDKCPFVNKKGKCSIYEVRPEVCAYYSCHNIFEYRPFNHKDKEVINMLLTFKPDAFCPNAPNIEALNLIYQNKKKQAYK